MSFTYTNSVRKTLVGRPTAKAILFILADHADEKGKCFPSIQYLSKTSELSDRAIKSAISFLEKNGFIRVHRIKGQVNRYQLFLNPLKQTDNQGKEEGAPSGDASSHSSVGGSLNEGKEVPPNHQENHQLNISNIIDYFLDVSNQITFRELLNFDPAIEENFLNIAQKGSTCFDQSNLSNLFHLFCNWNISPSAPGRESALKTPHKWALSWISWVNKYRSQLKQQQSKLDGKSNVKKKSNTGKLTSGLKNIKEASDSTNFKLDIFPKTSVTVEGVL